jgi:hypothetical protein
MCEQLKLEFDKGIIWKIAIMCWKEVNDNMMKFMNFAKLHEMLVMLCLFNVAVKWKNKNQIKLKNLVDKWKNWRKWKMNDEGLFNLRNGN